VQTFLPTYIDCLFANGHLQLISHPTRCTSTSASCIDHFITNCTQNTFETCILTNRISDHFPIFFFNNNPKLTLKSKFVFSRDFSKQNIEKFLKLITPLRWDDILVENDPDQALNMFFEKFFELYDNFFHQKRSKFNRNIHRIEKWFTKGLLVSRNNKHCLMKKSITVPSTANISYFKTYRNTYNKLVRASKKMYFASELEANAKNLKKTWQTLNQALCKSKKTNPILSLNVNDQPISDPKLVADTFNLFFTSIAEKISSNINPVPAEPEVEFRVREEDRFSMSSFPVSQAELVGALNQLQDKKSLDLNNISMNFIKQIISKIERPLLHIYSRSILSGKVPKKFKIAKVVPIFKSGDCLELNNYRPISLLSNFAKILEKIVYLRLSNFLETKNIISPSQYGFRKSHSTIHPMTHLLNKASSALNSKKHLLVIFCDLQKAFDTCDTQVLLKKFKKLVYRV